MTQEATKLLQQALRLPQKDRADLAANLLESLGENHEEEDKSTWSEEIKRRLSELRDGSVQPIAWPEARRLIQEPGNAGADS